VVVASVMNTDGTLKEGTTLMEYLGRQDAPITFIGGVTKKGYQFSASKRRVPVDNRDVGHFAAYHVLRVYE